MPSKRPGVLVIFVVLWVTWIAGQAAPNPAPRITGPIAATARSGDPSHNYPFFATGHLAEEHDYIEEEFFIEGVASEYAGDPNVTATVVEGAHPYKTRALVRRPKSPGKFNGTVILEWTNVAAGFGIDNDWYWSHQHLMRRGFVHIGVIVEPNGVHSNIGLRRWSPERYGALDLSANGKLTIEPNAFQLAHSIFTQVATAVRNPSGSDLLGKLKVKNIVATGHSRSAGRLSNYYNRVQPLERVIDGFVFHGAGASVRTDIRTPAWKLLSEGDVVWAQAPLRQPDSPYFRTWEVAGTAHADLDLALIINALGARDQPNRRQEPCEPPDGNRIPSHLVQDAVYDWMKLWIERGALPPQGPPIQLSSITPREQTPEAPPSAVAARDALGHALGGIRLAQHAVPTAMNTGLRPNTPPGSCRNRGMYSAFDAETLARLYPTRAKYTAEVSRITESNLKAGYITKEGAAQTKKDASAWRPPAR